MTLSFSTKWPKQMGELAGQPNYFVEKILASINTPFDVPKNSEYPFSPSIYESVKPKRHTIRAGNRWKKKLAIHPVVNNRTQNRFQFAPIMACEGVQSIEIIHSEYDGHKGLDFGSWVLIDNVVISSFWLNELAINDGFDSVEDFFAYFNTDFKGQIIHWTNLKY